MGCASFCCSLIVRLRDGEKDPGAPHNLKKRCVDKDPKSGRCVYQHPATGRCAVWASRPAICREYDCNGDPKLQTVLRHGFTSLMALIRATDTPERERLYVPYVDESGSNRSG
jgi:Fe-S-cluster containining protein